MLLGRETADRRGRRSRDRAGDRSGKTWSATYGVDVDRAARALRLVVRALPALVGRLRGVRSVLPKLAEARLRRRLPAADPPDRPHATARAGTTRSTPGRAIPAARGRSAAPEGGHDAIDPELGTLEDFDALVADARTLGIEIALDFAIQCSPDHPWLKRAPGVVPPPPGRDAEVRREPAEALPGHLQRQLRHRGLARALGRAARRRPATGSARRDASSASTTRTRSRCRSGSG